MILSSPSRVLITGAAGFIGAHLVARCLDGGHEVHVAVRPQTVLDRLGDVAGQIIVHRLQLNDRAALDRCLRAARPDTVFHLAAGTRRVPATDLVDAFASVDEDLRNLLALLAATAAAASPPRVLVRAGTLAEYGGGFAPHVEFQRELAVDAYGASMLAGTHYAAMLQPRLPFPVLTARLALTYGLGQSEAFLVPRLIANCVAGRPTTVARPNDRRDLIHVDDAVAGLLRLAAAPAPGGDIVNISTGIAPTMREVADLIVRATGASPALIRFSDGPVDAQSEIRASPALARARYGWSAAIPFAEGLAGLVATQRARQPVLEAVA